MNGPYMASTRTKKVHDINKITPECQTRDEYHFRKYFSPDTLEQAHKEGYSSCKHCLSKK